MRNPRSVTIRGLIVVVGSVVLSVGSVMVISTSSVSSGRGVREFGGIFVLLCAIAFLCGLVMTVVGAIGWSKQADGVKTVTAQPSAPAAGWLPDPTDPQLLRYWDGAQWTGQTAKREPGGGT